MDENTTKRVSIYFRSSAAIAEARGAYLADWRHGGAADTFGRWIADALDRHASLTSLERHGNAAEPALATTEDDPVIRSFSVPPAVVGRMHNAIAADQDADYYATASSWAADAIASAVAAARERNGGPLPTPPARLPNRLRRRH